MKNSRFLIYVTSFFILSSFSLMASYSEKESSNPIDAKRTELLKDNSPVGVWDYTVADAPYEYSTGVLYVTKEKDGYAVKVKLNYSTEKANNVSVDKNKLNFSVMVEGLLVKVALEVDDKGIKGKVDSPEGMFALVGKRSKK